MYGSRRLAATTMWNQPGLRALFIAPEDGRFAMRVVLGMILGALLLVVVVYAYDSMRTSSVANGRVAETNRTIVNWDVVASGWHTLKTRAHDDWVRISSK